MLSPALPAERLELPPGLTPPRLATPRDPSRKTYGGHTAAVAAGLGTPLIPWQQYVADVAGEVDDDGVFTRSLVLITVQRQAGKTQLDLAGGMQNATLGPNRRIWHTAQSGQDASDKWREMAETFDGSPLRKLAHKGSKGIRYSNGSESINLIQGSKIRPHPPSESALHGKQSDRNTIDEAWHFTAAQGQALRQAIGPTTTTRRMRTGQRAQLWVISTEGTVESTFFSPLLDAARAGDPEIALFDWGLLPGDDPTDLEVVAARHPGYGHLLDMQTLIDQQRLFADAPGEFARAFGNRRTGATERLFPIDPWNAAAWPDDMPEGRACLGAAVGIDGQDTSISVSIAADPETVVSAIVHDGHRSGTSWALEHLAAVCKATGAPVVIDPHGPSADLYDRAKRHKGITLLDDLRKALTPPEPALNSQAVAAAHAAMLAGITRTDGPPTWRYRPHEALDTAAELATRRYFSDGAWVIGRRASVGSVSALEACGLSSWGVTHLPPELGMQLF